MVGLFCCDQCTFSGASILAIADHEKVHQAKTFSRKSRLMEGVVAASQLQCGECSFVGADEGELLVHFRLHIALKGRAGKVRWQCPKCEFKDDGKREVLKHYQGHSPQPRT